MKGFVEFIIVSINEVEREILIDLKEIGNIELNTILDDLIDTLEV